VRLASLAPLLLVLGCPEPPSAPLAVSPDTATEGVATDDPIDDVLHLDGKQVRRGETSLATLRAPDAPGVLDDDLLPSYAYPELVAALASAPPSSLRIADDATTGAVRGVLSSLPQGTSIALALGDDRSIALRAAPRGDLPWLRRSRDTIELRNPDGAVAGVAPIATPGDALARARGAKAIALELDDRTPAATLLAIATAVAAAGASELVVAIDYAPCLVPPADMSCVPGGLAIVGSDDDAPEERPRREIDLSTYYIDRHEITVAQYDACHAAGACPRRVNATEKIMKPFVAADQPAMPLDWIRAVRFCAWAGKRLPSEWEWEKAARGPDGDRYSWGNDPVSCDRAQYRECAPARCEPYPGKEHRWDCNEHHTKPVGSYAAGHYGLFDMAGNAYEWTASAGPEDVASCGASCGGRDPRGACDGAGDCGRERVLRGGSWYWPGGRIHGSHRRLELRLSGGHRLSARCAAQTPVLTAFPPTSITRPPAPPPTPPAPDEAQRAIAAKVVQDPIEDKKICSEAVRNTWGSLQSRGGRSETTCRDPFPYLESNEPRAWLWRPYLVNLGGGYLGVGSDQNYSFIAIARSEWAWVMDYDPRVVDHHLRLRAFVLEAATIEEFIDFWAAGSSKRAFAAIERHNDPAQHGKLRWGYSATRERLHEYYEAQSKPARGRPDDYGWLANPEHYAYVRELFATGRLHAIKGDLLGTKSIQTVCAALRELGVPMRVFYTSNAPSSWGGTITPSYRENLRALPFDARSIVLQTMGKGAFKQTGHWHHNVQGGRHMQQLLAYPGYDTVMELIFERIPTDHGDLTAIGLPSSH
jgi:formylglycine-generating enzyme required for sulfatase activity